MAELTRKRCFLQEKLFFSSLFSVSALIIFGGGRGIELGDFSKSIYYRRRNIHFLSNRENFLDADKYHFPEG